MDKILARVFAALPPWRRVAINRLVAAVIAMLVIGHRVTGDQGAALAAFWVASAHLLWLLLCAMTDRTGPTPAWRQSLYAVTAAAFGLLTAWEVISGAQANVWLPLVADLAGAGLAVIWTDPAPGAALVRARPLGDGQVMLTQGIAYAGRRPAGQATGKTRATWHPSDGPSIPLEVDPR